MISKEAIIFMFVDDTWRKKVLTISGLAGYDRKSASYKHRAKSAHLRNSNVAKVRVLAPHKYKVTNDNQIQFQKFLSRTNLQRKCCGFLPPQFSVSWHAAYLKLSLFY